MSASVCVASVVGGDNQQPVLVFGLLPGRNRRPYLAKLLVDELHGCNLLGTVAEIVPDVVWIFQVNPGKVRAEFRDIFCCRIDHVYIDIPDVISCQIMWKAIGIELVTIELMIDFAPTCLLQTIPQQLGPVVGPG